MTPPNDDAVMRPQCEFCGGFIVDGSKIYVRGLFPNLRYRHVEHGPFPSSPIKHTDSEHTPRCTTGACYD